jgi:hypothetical protein
LADVEAFQQLLRKMHETAMREERFAKGSMAWLTGAEMIKHCSMELSALLAGGVPAAQGLCAPLRKYDGIPVENLRFRVEKRALADRTGWKPRWAFGVELRSGAQESGIEAPQPRRHERLLASMGAFNARQKRAE